MATNQENLGKWVTYIDFLHKVEYVGSSYYFVSHCLDASNAKILIIKSPYEQIIYDLMALPRLELQVRLCELGKLNSLIIRC